MQQGRECAPRSPYHAIAIEANHSANYGRGTKSQRNFPERHSVFLEFRSFGIAACTVRSPYRKVRSHYRKKVDRCLLKDNLPYDLRMPMSFMTRLPRPVSTGLRASKHRPQVRAALSQRAPPRTIRLSRLKLRRAVTTVPVMQCRHQSDIRRFATRRRPR